MQITKLPLRAEEKKKLVKARNFTILVMSIMLAVTLGIAYAALSVSDAMFFPVLFFLIFFIGVQVFIVAIRVKQSQATEKTVYTGMLTEKKSHTSQMKNSSFNETYSVKLDDEWFSVESQHFFKIHQGEKVSIHTVRNRQVIEVETLEEISKHHYQELSRNFVSSVNFSEQTNEAENKILNSKILFAVIFRLIIGFLGMRLLQLFLGFFVVLISIALESDSTGIQIMIAYFISWLIYIWLNLKTVKLIIDRLSGNTITVSEQIIDKQISNSWKPTQNSVVTTRNYQNNYSDYYYLQTSKYWLSISKEIYDSLETGGIIQIRRSKLAKVLLEIQGSSKLTYR